MICPKSKYYNTIKTVQYKKNSIAVFTTVNYQMPDGDEPTASDLV